MVKEPDWETIEDLVFSIKRGRVDFVKLCYTGELKLGDEVGYNQFELLPNWVKEGIKYTIWKTLNPQNNKDADFGRMIIKNHADELFMVDVINAAVKGLRAGIFQEQWYLEMPSNWKSHIKF